MRSKKYRFIKRAPVPSIKRRGGLKKIRVRCESMEATGPTKSAGGGRCSSGPRGGKLLIKLLHIGRKSLLGKGLPKGVCGWAVSHGRDNSRTCNNRRPAGDVPKQNPAPRERRGGLKNNPEQKGSVDRPIGKLLYWRGRPGLQNRTSDYHSGHISINNKIYKVGHIVAERPQMAKKQLNILASQIGGQLPTQAKKGEGGEKSLAGRRDLEEVWGSTLFGSASQAGTPLLPSRKKNGGRESGTPTIR